MPVGMYRCGSLSARMNHVSRIREADAVAAAIRFYDGACTVVGALSSPVALEFEQHLNPARHDCGGCLHAPKREIVALGRNAAARVADDEDFEPGRAAPSFSVTCRGVFAIGDVRAKSIKRVAAAVGEGAQVVAALHSFFAADAHNMPAVPVQSH